MLDENDLTHIENLLAHHDAEVELCKKRGWKRRTVIVSSVLVVGVFAHYGLEHCPESFQSVELVLGAALHFAFEKSKEV